MYNGLKQLKYILHFFFLYVTPEKGESFTARVNFGHKSVIYFWLRFSHRSYHYQGCPHDQS